MLQALSVLVPVIDKAIGRVFPDKTKQAKIMAEIKTAMLDLDAAELENASKIIMAEAQSESWLARNWRPILMLTITAIVGVHYLVFPLINVMFGSALNIDLPERLWDLLTVGVGGYVVGRSGEKIAREYKK